MAVVFVAEISDRMNAGNSGLRKMEYVFRNPLFSDV